MTENYSTNDEVQKAVQQASKRSYRAQRGYVDEMDLYQEAWLWVFAHPAIMEDLMTRTPRKPATNLLTLKLYQALHNYTQKQRYLKDGTQPGDYFTYKKEILEALLPEALDGAPAVQAESETDQQVRSRRAPSETGDRMAMLADVKAGVASLSQSDKGFLYAKFCASGLTDAELGWKYGVSEGQASRRLTSVLQRLAKFLGSDVPVQRRRVVSNASAQAATSSQQDD